MAKLKKGSKAAKDFMAKLRAAKGKGKKRPAAKKKKAKKAKTKHKKSLGAAGDYAKFELSTIKALAKLLKKPLKETQKVINTSSKLLDIISDSFNAKKTPLATAKILKEELKEKLKHNPTNAFIQLLSKLPKKEAASSSAKFPMKLPATVTIGNINNTMLSELKNTITLIERWKIVLHKLKTDYKIVPKQYKGSLRTDIYRVKNVIADLKLQAQRLKRNIK